MWHMYAPMTFHLTIPGGLMYIGCWRVGLYACMAPCLLFGKTQSRLKDRRFKAHSGCNSDVRLYSEVYCTIELYAYSCRSLVRLSLTPGLLRALLDSSKARTTRNKAQFCNSRLLSWRLHQLLFLSLLCVGPAGKRGRRPITSDRI